MGYTILSTEKGKLLAWLALLSKYSLFHVSVSNGAIFNCTEVAYNSQKFFEFKRMFATSVFSDNIIEDVWIDNGLFFCCTKSCEYEICPLELRPTKSVIREKKDWDSIFDLIDTEFIGEQYTDYLKQLDMLLLVVDPYLLGELTTNDRRKIKRLINVYLDGSSRFMQLSRTVCFQVKLHDSQKRVYAGVYDLEHRQSITSVLLYSEHDKEILSEAEYNKIKQLQYYARTNSTYYT